MTTLLEKILALDEALSTAEVPHAFGGALALAYCVGEPRGTVDIDVNVFLAPDAVDEVLAAMPGGITWDDTDRRLLVRDGQARGLRRRAGAADFLPLALAARTGLPLPLAFAFFGTPALRGVRRAGFCASGRGACSQSCSSW